jgi:hypothetical protein
LDKITKNNNDGLLGRFRQWIQKRLQLNGGCNEPRPSSRRSVQKDSKTAQWWQGAENRKLPIETGRGCNEQNSNGSPPQSKDTSDKEQNHQQRGKKEAEEDEAWVQIIMFGKQVKNTTKQQNSNNTNARFKITMQERQRKDGVRNVARWGQSTQERGVSAGKG